MYRDHAPGRCHRAEINRAFSPGTLHGLHATVAGPLKQTAMKGPCTNRLLLQNFELQGIHYRWLQPTGFLALPPMGFSPT
jgi:hypothetical protein